MHSVNLKFLCQVFFRPKKEFEKLFTWRTLETMSYSSFTKWRGRNFVGFVEFPSFPLTYMQKKNYVVVLRWFVFVCPSVCPSPRKSAVTFDPLDGSARNFQGLLNSLQVIFGQVTRTPGPSGSGPDPKKAGLCYLSYHFPPFSTISSL